MGIGCTAFGVKKEEPINLSYLNSRPKMEKVILPRIQSGFSIYY